MWLTQCREPRGPQMISSFLSCLSLLLGLTCLLVPSLGSAQAAPVQVTFQLKERITLHEPVVLLFKVHNASMQDAVLDLGVAKTQFFHFSLKKPNGATVQNEPLYAEGFYPSGKVIISAGGNYEQDLVLNQWFEFDSTGQYSLAAQLKAHVDATEIGNPEPEQISFEIEDRSPERLKKICADLVERVKLAPNAEAAQAPALLLSYVRDPIAIPYLSQLLNARKLVEKAGISGLERICTKDSVEELISALNSQYGDTSDLAREALKRILRRSSDPVLKQTIRSAGVT